MFTGAAGKTIYVKDVEMNNELGYTKGDDVIYIARKHSVMETLNEEERRMFRLGVGAHELLHCKLTDFTLRERLISGYPIYEQRIVAFIDNLLEDPAIEFFAPTIFGGVLLNALRFSITHIYKLSPNIEEKETPFKQFIHALIQFGDMGLIKGRFTYPEARKVFIEAAPIFGAAIEEPEPIKRCDYSRQITEISRPLWKDEAEFEKEMMDLLKELSKLGTGKRANGSGKPNSNPGKQENQPLSLTQKRRRITIKKVTKEELEDIKNNNEVSEGELPEEGDITILVCDEDNDQEKEDNEEKTSLSADASDESEERKDSKSSSDTSSKKQASQNGENDANDVKNNSKNGKKSSSSNDDNMKGSNSQAKKSSDMDNEDTGDSGDSGSGDNCSEDEKDSLNSQGEASSIMNSGNSTNSNDNDSGDDCSDDGEESNDFYKNDNTGRNERDRDSGNENIPVNSHTTANDYEGIDEGDYEIQEDEYKVSDDDLQDVQKALERVERELEKEEKQIEENDLSDIDFPISTPRIKKANCRNIRVEMHPNGYIEGLYNNVINDMSVGISSMAAELQRLFRNDTEEIIHHTSGKINVVRAINERPSAKIFDKRKDPAEIDDIALMILVDESGSMGNTKSTAARNACIALSEAFAKLKKPVYIMGFTTEDTGHDAVHYHYVKWINSKLDRMKLLNIKGRNCNFDSYSIRYGLEILKRKNAQHKIMIILSDGTPSAYNYNKLGVNGVTDTKDVVREARRYASVLGVAVGNCDAEAIHYIYERDFIHIDNVDELFSKISSQIRSIVRGWE